MPNATPPSKPAQFTEIAIVLDRSASMGSIRAEMEQGLWSMIEEQRAQPGRCRISLYRFDNEFEIAFEGVPADNVMREHCVLMPRGSTALNDAVVKSLTMAEERIKAEQDAPDLVVVVVITDGEENCSREATTAGARAAIVRATETLGWHFAFLASDPSGFADGQRMTAGTRAAGGVRSFAATSGGTSYANHLYSCAVSNLRGGQSLGLDFDQAALDLQNQGMPIVPGLAVPDNALVFDSNSAGFVKKP